MFSTRVSGIAMIVCNQARRGSLFALATSCVCVSSLACNSVTTGPPVGHEVVLDGGRSDGATGYAGGADASAQDAASHIDAAPQPIGSGAVEGDGGFAIKDSLAFPVMWGSPTADGGGPSGATVMIGQFTPMCSNHYEPESPFLMLELYQPGVQAMMPGAFTVVNSFDFGRGTKPLADFMIATLDTTCDLSVRDVAVSGDVDVTSASRDAIEGTYRVKLSKGGTLTGQFKSPYCASGAMRGIGCMNNR